MAVVYCHRKRGTGDIFYVGIGKSNVRAFSTSFRNNIWHKIVAKYDYTVDILYEDITWEEAKLLEIQLIATYGRIYDNSGILANITKGGDGVSGYKHSDEWKKLNSLKHKGKIITEEHKQAISVFNRGKICTIDTKDKIRDKLIEYHNLRGRKVYPKKYKRKDLIWINNDIINKKIGSAELSSFIQLGWVEGRLLSTETKNKMSGIGSKWMYNSSSEKMILSNNTQEYIEKGWCFGRKRKSD
jgi:hypothetical protein